MPRRPFRLEIVGKRRHSAARGMARLGFAAAVIAIVLRLKLSTAQAIVEARHAPASLWSAGERALFREAAE